MSFQFISALLLPSGWIPVQFINIYKVFFLVICLVIILQLCNLLKLLVLWLQVHPRALTLGPQGKFHFLSF